MIDLQEAANRANALVKTALEEGGPGDMTAHLARSVGKGARTMVLLNCAMNADELVHENAPKAAAAIELLHMATLVHDDVIDDADIRRGQPTAHRVFGKRNAVICGDYLLCLSLSQLTALERVGGEERLESLASRFSAALAEICRGEYRQHQNAGNADLDLFTYLKIISGKTAALFYISAYVGALIGDEPDKAARALGRYGRCLGMVFQMLDDCKDYDFTEEQAGKPVGNDIRGGFVTLPLILAMRQAPALRGLAQAALGSPAEIPALLEATRQAGGTLAAKQLAKRYETRATQALDGFTGAKRDNLAAILQKAAAAAQAF